jgi:hypothetical protein
MGIEGGKSRGTFGSYLDCADEVLALPKAQFEIITRNHCLRSELPPDVPWVDWSKLLHRAFILATQI